MKRLAGAWPALVIVLFVAIFLLPELAGTRVSSTASLSQWLPWSAHGNAAVDTLPSFNPDYLTSYHPRRALLHDAWRSGELPLWNPYSFCGMPFLADPQTQVLYPPSWLLLPCDPARALGYFLFLHLTWAAVGMWRLLRRYELTPGIAVLGGCAYALSGFLAKHFGLPPFLAAGAWLPWVLLATDHVIERPSLAAAARLALAGALLFLAGQPQIALIGAHAVALFTGVRLLQQHGKGRAHAPRVILALVAGAGIAVLVVGAQLLPTLELAARSERARLPLTTVMSGAFHPVEAIRFLVPDFFGTPMARDEWSALFPRGDSFYGRIQLNSVFAGTPVFLFAIVGMVHPRTWRRALPFTAIFILFSLIAFGTPLARAAHAWLPGFSFARLDRAGSVIVLAQFVPAALAASTLGHDATRARRWLGVALIGLAVAGAWLVARAGTDLPSVLGAVPGLSPEELRFVLAATPTRTFTAALFMAGAGAALLLPAGRLAAKLPLALAALQLFLFASPYRADRRPDEVFHLLPELASLREALEGPGGGYRMIRFGRSYGRAARVSDVVPPSTNAVYGIRDVQGYNALADRRLGDALERATGEPLFSHGIWSGRRIVAPTRAESLGSPLLSALSVRIVVSRDPVDAPGWSRAEAVGPLFVGRNDRALPRVRLTPSGRGVSAVEMERLLGGNSFDPAREVLWRGEGQAGAPDSVPRPPEVLSDRIDHLRVRTNADHEAILVVADTDDPGWRASIDGKAAEILPAWGLVRAVVVPPGAHFVEMAYRPASFARGGLLSLLGLLLAAAALAVARDSRPPRPPGT